MDAARVGQRALRGADRRGAELTSSTVQSLSRVPGGFDYLLKDRIADLGELTEAIKRVAAGEPFIDWRSSDVYRR
ncbi:hypothetical protein [Streptomyces bluensis]|uniref:Uncharacterized protein n=1 Tax=Streptomyces bluensis TaxID=33897 RepID=A0ABW6UGV4_9ACTN